MHLHESVFEAPQTSRELMGPPSRSRRPQPAGSADPRAGRLSKRRRAAFLRAVCLAILFLALACLALGCAPQTRPPVWEDQPQLVEVESHAPGRLFVKDEHRLGHYDDLLLEKVGFRYRDGQAKLGAADEGRIKTMLVAAVEAGRDGAIGVATQPGSCVLAVDFFVRDLELADRTRWAGSFSEFRRSLGSATLILELRDSQSEEPLARFIERRDLGGGWWKGQREEQFQRLARAIGFAIRDMGIQLSRITSPPSSGWDDRCGGAMAKVALGSHR